MMPKRGACFSDPAFYFKVRETLEKLLVFSEILEQKARTDKQRKVIRITSYVRKEVSILIEQIAAWQADDEICYDEFISRIRRYYSTLRTVASVLGVVLPGI